MTYLARFIAAAAVFICADLCLAQNTNSSSAPNNTNKQPATAVRKDDEKRKPDPQALVFVRAGREKIYALLEERMKPLEFTLGQKDDKKIVFSKRTPGAEAANRRRQFNRSLATPIVDDPRTILAFFLIEKDNGYVVAGRMIVTTIRKSQILSADVSGRKEIKAALLRILEKLKTDAETRKF